MATDNLSDDSADSGVSAGEDSAILLSVSAARNLCSMYRDELVRKRRRWLDTCNGEYRRQSAEWFEHDMHSEKDLSPSQVFDIEESHVLEEVAGIACALERCVDPNNDALKDYSTIVDEAIHIYGEDRLHTHIINARTRAEEVAGAKLPLTQRVPRKRVVPPSAILTIGVYEPDFAPGDWGSTNTIYKPVTSLFNVPPGELPMIPRPATIVVSRDDQRYRVNPQWSLAASEQSWTDKQKGFLRDKLDSGLEKLLLDRPAQFYVQEIVKTLTAK